MTFPVFALGRIPVGMYFAGATGGPERVSLDYRATNQSAFLMIMEEPFTGAGNQLAGEVGADAVIQSVPGWRGHGGIRERLV